LIYGVEVDGGIFVESNFEHPLVLNEQ
jgi:hypothetical protein